VAPGGEFEGQSPLKGATQEPVIPADLNPIFSIDRALMQVLKASTKHLPIVIEMMRELAQSGVRDRDEIDEVLDLQLRRIIDDDEWTALILRTDEEVVAGYAIFRLTQSFQHPGETVALVHDFLVRRSFRRRGFGRRFLAHIQGAYWRGQAEHVFVTIPGMDERAVKFFENVGFQVQGVRLSMPLKDS
jgi:GNAT superfamily N-acetyltransferase